MAVKIDRKVLPSLKIEVVTLTDKYGAEHKIQQPILPLAEASTDEERALLRDWHEAVIEMARDFHQRREDAVTEACLILNRPHEPMLLKQPDVTECETCKRG